MRMLAKFLGNRHLFRLGGREGLCRARSIHSSESGFTLLELMVTISVAAVLIAIAVPSYRSIIISNRLTTATNAFVAGVNIAKIEAVRRNSATQFCAGTSSNNGTDDLGTACGTAAGAVYVLDGTVPTKLYEAPLIPADISVSAVTALRYSAQGLARKIGDSSPMYTGLLADISTSKLRTGNHRCIYVTTGSTISTCTYTATSGGCDTSEPSTATCH